MEDKYVYIWSLNRVDGVRILETGREGATYRAKIEYNRDGSIFGTNPKRYSKDPVVISMLTPEAIAEAEKRRRADGNQE